MASSFIGAISAQATSVDISGLGVAARDLIIVAAYRNTSNTPPSLPAGFFNLDAATGANTNGMRIGYKFAASGSDTSGTWANATKIEVRAYRGPRGVGAIAVNGGSSASMGYLGLTLLFADGTSEVVAIGGHRTSSSSGLVSPAGMSNIDSDGGTQLITGSDTNGGVSSWSSANVTVAANSGWRTFVGELLASEALNAYDKSATLALSGGNLVATNTGTVTPKAVRAATSRITGKWVWAAVCTTYATGDDTAPGMATIAHPLGTRIEQALTAFRWAADDGAVGHDNTTLATVQTWGQGDKLFFARDFDTGDFWLGKNIHTGGAWYGASGPSGPEGGGGAALNFDALNGVDLYPILSLWNSDGVWTFDPTASGHGLTTFDPWQAAGGIAGSLSKTLGAITCAATAAIAVAGTANNTFGALGVSAAGQIANAGVLAATLPGVTLVATGTGLNGVSGSLAQTLGAVTLLAAGAAPVAGVAAITLGAVTSTAAGKVTNGGALAATLPAVTLAASAQAAIRGVLSKTLGDVTLSAAGLVVAGRTGSLDQSLGVLTFSGAGQVLVRGSAAIELGAVVLTAVGGIAVKGVLAATLDPISIEAGGGTFEPIAGSAAIHLGALILTASGRNHRWVSEEGLSDGWTAEANGPAGAWTAEGQPWATWLPE